MDDEHAREMLSYHWHPFQDLPKHPHLHLKRVAENVREDFQKAHVPTDRMSIEAGVSFLITDLGVKPRRDDWQEVIERNREVFERYRTWA